MKKIAIIFSAILIIFVLFGCGSKNKMDEKTNVTAPDGIDVDVQFLDDCTGFVIYTNETGEDISLETNVVCVDDYFDILGVFGTYGSMVKNGEKHIDIIETRDPIVSYQVDCSIGHIRQSVKNYNEAIGMTYWANDDKSISVAFTSSSDEFISFFATVYYLDESGKIIGYETSSPQFIYDMGGTFEIPEFDYEDYYVLYEVN